MKDLIDQTANIPWYFDPQWIAVMIQLLMLIIAVGAILFAYNGVKKQIRSSRDIAKKTKAIDFILEAERSDLHEKGLSVIYKYIDQDEKSIARLAENNGVEEEDKTDLANLLNYYEYLSVAVKHNILCESTLKKANFSMFLTIVKISRPFIVDVRTKYKKPHCFKELEWLYDRWKNQEYDTPCDPIL